jgi:hypothetical protein
VLDEQLPLLAAGAGSASFEAPLALPRGDGTAPLDFFDHGLSLVAGKAALVRAGADPGAAALAAAQAGARAVLVYGKSLPSGSLGISTRLGVPVVAVPAAAVAQLLEAEHSGYEVAVAIGRTETRPNGGIGRVAPFSSRGLSFGGYVEPSMTAPGTGLASSDPGAGAEGEPSFATVNGTSAAAATVAGAAALLAQERPGLGAVDLRSLLVGYANPSGQPLTTAGLGEIDVGAAAAAEVAADTTSIAFGAWRGKVRTKQTFVLRNVSTRRVQVRIAVPGGDTDALRVAVKPSRASIGVGKARRITVTASGDAARLSPAETGVITVTVPGGEPLRIPWSLVVPPGRSLLPQARIDPVAFRPSDVEPAVLQVRAGAVVDSTGLQILPASRLDVLLYTAGGKFVGVLARLRDLLPGTYSFGITGRDAKGRRLKPGRYEVRLVAWPVLGRIPSRNLVRFTIEGRG